MKKIILAFLLLSSVFAYSQEVEKIDDAEAKIRNERLAIFEWGTPDDVKELINRLIGEEDDSYVEQVIALLDAPFVSNVIEEIFGYLKKFKSPAAFDNAVEILKFFDEYPDNTVKLAISYLDTIADQLEFDDEFAEILWMIVETDHVNTIILTLALIKKTNLSQFSDKLLKLYKQSQTDSRLKPRILSVLAYFKHPEAFDEIKNILSDSNEDKSLRWEACRSAVYYVGNADLEKILAGLLDDNDAYLRMYAYEALFSVATDPEKYFKNSFRDNFWKIRQTAIRVAGEKKLVEYVGVLKYLAENDKEQVIKKNAIEALGRIGGEEAEDFLVALLFNTRKSPDLRISAIEALDLAKSKSYYHRLTSIFDEKMQDKQKYALLGKIADICRYHDYDLDLEIFFKKCIESNNFVLKVSALRWILHTKVVFSKDLIKSWSEKEKKNLVGRLSLQIIQLDTD
ncbi:MAG: HEAT repeat domain-containing protein [Spirochaetales bacterium]|nr:HEAT repeat domain-containing protein [Spirochaetales bacterium]